MGSNSYICDECGEEFDSPAKLGGHTKIHSGPSKQEVLQDVARVAEELGWSPSRNEYKKRGMFSAKVCLTRFDTWNGTLEAAGLERNSRGVGNRRKRKDEDELLEELHRLADDLGRTPTQEEMDELGKFSQRPYRTAFGTWNKALQAASLEPNNRIGISTQELINDLQKAASVVDGRLTRAEYDELAEFSTTLHRERFGSWNEAKAEAGLETPPTRSELLDELHRLDADLETPPSARDMRQKSQYNPSMYQAEFESWNAALECAGLETREPGSAPKELNGNWREGSTHKYGPNWPKQRQRALERDNFRCQSPGCGMTQEEHLSEYGRGIEVHHIRPRREFVNDSGELDAESANQLDNLVTFCHPHHRRWEGIPLAPSRPD